MKVGDKVKLVRAISGWRFSIAQNTRGKILALLGNGLVRVHFNGETTNILVLDKDLTLFNNNHPATHLFK